MTENYDQAQPLEAHRNYLQRYALFHLRNASFAEVAVQGTLTAARVQRKRLAGRSQPRTWRAGTLEHKNIDPTRGRERGLPPGALMSGEGGDVIDRVSNASGHWIDPPADWRSPAAALESLHFSRVYQECCQHMRRRDALAFSMREVMGIRRRARSVTKHGP